MVYTHIHTMNNMSFFFCTMYEFGQYLIIQAITKSPIKR